MARQSTVIDVFLSSPDDVDQERDFIVDAAQAWNLLRSRDTQCHINVITWKDILAPALGERPQAVINDQVGDDYDVYVGLMWSKLGSSTGVADSGTVEEFDRALDRYRGGDAVRISFFFKEVAIPPSILIGAQFDKVVDFRSRLGAEGGLYRKFKTDDELRTMLNRLFEQIAASKEEISYASSASVIETQLDSDKVAAKDLIEHEAGSQDLSDMGLIDFNDQLALVTDEQGKFFEDWTVAMERNSTATSKASSEMSELTKFGKADSSELRPVVNRMSASMDELSTFIESNITEFSARNDRILALTDAGLDIAKDFSGDETGKDDLRTAVTSLLVTILQNKNNLSETVEIVSGLPRMSTVFNRAKKRMINSQAAMFEEFSRLHDQLTSILQRS